MTDRKKRKTSKEKELLEVTKTGDVKTNDFYNLQSIKETKDYNFERETPPPQIPEIRSNIVSQQKRNISFDYLKLRLPGIYADETQLEVETDSFFRSSKPEIPAKRYETSVQIFNEKNPARQMTLSEEEEKHLNFLENQEFRKAKLKFPNAKPFYDTKNNRLGVIHIYFKDGDCFISIIGKIVSEQGSLGLINKDNIDTALKIIKSNGLIKFNNKAFKQRAEVLSVHVTTDLTVPNVNTYIKAFSSFLPIRTDKYNILKYQNCGYEILPNSRHSKMTPKYEACIYNKGKEIRGKNSKKYIDRIGADGLCLANNTLRIELRLQNFPAIRKFLAPDRDNGTVTLEELLACEQTPIIEFLNLLEITPEHLRKARGRYIELKDGKLPTQSEFERMHGIIQLLKINDYNLEKVRSYVEAETGKKTPSGYFKEKRDLIQSYIACYMPETVATLTEIVESISY